MDDCVNVLRILLLARFQVPFFTGCKSDVTGQLSQHACRLTPPFFPVTVLGRESFVVSPSVAFMGGPADNVASVFLIAAAPLDPSYLKWQKHLYAGEWGKRYQELLAKAISAGNRKLAQNMLFAGATSLTSTMSTSTPSLAPPLVKATPSSRSSRSVIST